ncbi:MAG: phospho-N-acetylmuramoyl-pentapeptide-transferase [Candidatus Peregrinibacteria bacterium]
MLPFIPVRPEISLIAILLYALLAFVIGIAATPAFINFLKKHRLGKQLRTETIDGRAATIFNKFHEKKKGVPTMGGILIWGAILITVLLSRLLAFFGLVDSSLLQRGQVYLPLFMLISFGLLGALDDYLNICMIGKKRGLDWMPKMLTFLLLSGAGACWFYFKLGYNSIDIPFYHSVTIGWWYIPFFILVIVATANAVNVTDGLDGLAGGLLAIAFSAFAVLAYMKGLAVLSAFCAVSVGAIAAFLWFNVPPAHFIMGDTGALALGAVLGAITLMIDQVLVLPLIGFIFVIEMLSVIVQLTSKKLRNGKKIFLAAPIHHHFEALEWGESKVTMRFWIIGAFIAFLGIIVGMFG